MSWYGLATFCVVYAVAVATPGPGVAAIIARGLARGTAGAPAFIAGFVVGDLLWFFAAALGLSALAQTAHTAFVVLKFAGAAYLLFLAYKLWTAPVSAAAEDSAQVAGLGQRPMQLFLGTLTLTMSNPKTMIFYVALLPTIVPLESLTPDGYAEIALAILVILPVILGSYVVAAARARNLFRSPRSRRAINRGSGTVLAAAAVAVATR